MPKFSHHIFICCNQRSPGHARGCCDRDGSEQLRHAFKAEVKSRGLNPLVRANKAGCLDQCELGPVVVIYPQAIWYGRVTLPDVERIVDRTLVHGEILEDLLLSDEELNVRHPGSTGNTGGSSGRVESGTGGNVNPGGESDRS